MNPADVHTFTAIDFETAEAFRNSACAVGLVRVEHGVVVERDAFLIRPPFDYVRFSRIHGITWPMVAGEPLFGDLWPRVEHIIDGVQALVAHNAPFDRSVLYASCEGADLPKPNHPFICTVAVARRAWPGQPANLPAICDRLGIALRHHDPASDAEACARIFLAAQNLQRS
jgi:DNA polymerase-3 subunit epsilon